MTYNVNNSSFVAASSGESGKTFAAIVKSIDQSLTSDTTLQDDSELLFTAKADTIYTVLLMISATGSLTGDVKSAFSVPTNASFKELETLWKTDTPPPFETVVFQSHMSEGTNRPINTWAVITIGDTAGQVAYSWAQWSADSVATTIQAGSVMVVWESV